MFAVAGIPMEKEDYFLLAEVMRPDEIHPEVVNVLDAIGSLVAPAAAEMAGH